MNWTCPKCSRENETIGLCNGESCSITTFLQDGQIIFTEILKVEKAPQEKVINCLICEKPLGEFEISVSRRTHKDCEVCHVCKNVVNNELVENFLRGKVDYIGHRNCHEKYLTEELEKRPITVTQGYLDKLNNIALMMSPVLSRSIEDNVSLAETCGGKQWLHLSSIDEKYIALKMMEAITASWSVLYHNDKKAMDVSAVRELQDKQRKKDLKDKMADVESFRTSEQRTLEIKREKKSPDWKLIKSYVNMGMSEDQARELLKEQKAAIRGPKPAEPVN